MILAGNICRRVATKIENRKEEKEMGKGRVVQLDTVQSLQKDTI